jgi:CO/xanthine dehydrogenase Mo-binding subunit/aerobic-type carbon monoxide dehydrogenase small subunit (CoxS/CutS family)
VGDEIRDPSESRKTSPQVTTTSANAAELEDPTRRSFLQLTTGAAIGAAALSVTGYELVQLTKPDQVPGRGNPDSPYATHQADIMLRINGKEHRLRVPHQRTLLLALREDLGLTGTKKSCNLGQCGACTVLLDGLPVYSCFVFAMDAVGKDILTIEGLSKEGTVLHPVQQGFIERMGSQCGHCTPGMIMSGVGLLMQNPNPTLEDVRFALSGNLCRCGNYPNEIAGVLFAVGKTNQAAASATTGAPAGANTRPPGTEITPILEAANPNRPLAITPQAPLQLDISAEGNSAPGLRSTVPTLDARAKVTGEALYAGDFGFHADDPVKDVLFAKVVRSPYALAEIGEIDDSKVRELTGYRGMVTYRDVPGDIKRAGWAGGPSPASSDRLCLNDKARYVGDAVAAVAADDQYTAQEAMELVHVEYRPLRAYPDAEYNLNHQVKAIHSQPLAGFAGPQPADKPTVEFKRGNVEDGFKQADIILEGRYTTPIQCHVPVEPHSVVALWEGNRVTFWDSQQSVFRARDVLATALGVDPENVRVIAKYVGGGFGGKCTDTPGKTLYQVIAALLSQKTGRPVRLEYTLKELMFAEDTRNPFVFQMKTGVKKDGTITALECKAIECTGGYASSGPAVVAVAGEGIIDTYRVPNYWYHGYSVYTSSPVGGEMRGFGHPQAVFAREVHMDEVAEAVGINPLDFRIKNSLHKGDVIDTDVAPDITLENIGAEECLRKGAEAIGWSRWEHHSKKSGRVRRGLGLRFSQEHTGRNASNGLVWMDPKGTIHLSIGSGNLGTNAHTGVAVIVAAVLGVPIEQLDVTWGDSSDGAWDYVSDASRAVHCHGKAMYNAALDLNRQLQARKAGSYKARTDFTPYYDPKTDINPLLDEETGKVEKDPAPKLHPKTEAKARKIVAEGGIVGLGFYVWNPAVESWGASFAEVEVDMETGQVSVLKLVAAHDCGRVIHRIGAEAQVHGGGVMGFGYGMTEELVVDPHTGIPVNQSLYEYRPPTILDIPELVPILVEAPAQAGPFGAKGLGENPIFDAAAAVGNAIYNATGVRMREIPYTWPRVFDELKRAGKLA